MGSLNVLQCESSTQATEACAEGTLSGGRCVIIAAATRGCPAGYSYASLLNTCQQAFTGRLACPATHPILNSRGRCISTNQGDVSTRAPSVSCPGGFWTGSGRTCVRYRAVVYSCSAGTLLGNATCRSTAAATLSCTAGVLVGNRCLIVTSPTYSCTSGTLSGRSCVSSITSRSTPEYSCTTGVLVGNRCLIVTSPTYSCTSGTLSGTSCRTVTEPAYECPQGHTLNGQQCDHDDPDPDPPSTTPTTATTTTAPPTATTTTTSTVPTTTTTTVLPASSGCSEPLGVLGSEELTPSGSWAASDRCVSSQRGDSQTRYYAKRFTFKLDVDAEVTIGLSSSRDAYLYLLEGHGTEGDVRAENDDADSTTSDSRLVLDLAAGLYTIEATTVEARQQGSFTLTVSTDIVAPVVQITGLQGSYGAIEGELLSFSFGYKPNSAVPSLEPVTPKGLALHLTSSAGVASVSGKPSLAGTYTVKFSQPGRAGRDTTTVKVVCPVGHTQQPDRSCEPSADACMLGLGTLEVGSQLAGTGTWAPSCVLPPGRRFRSGTYYAKHYTFTLEKPAVVTIDLESKDQDTYLFLLRGHGPGGARLRHDDDSGEGTNSRLSDVALAAGDYTVSASTYLRRRTGDFTVGLEIVCTTELGTLGTAWVTRKGRWSDSDGCVSSQRGDADDAHNARFYTFKLAEAGDVTVELTSSADAYLYLYYGDGTAAAPLAQNDNDRAGGSTTDSRLVLRLPAGDYTIEATTRDPGAEDDFTLRAKDPELKVAATVHQPWSHEFYFVHLAGTAQPQVSVTKPGLSLKTKPEYLTARAYGADIRFVKVTVSATPELAGDYPITVKIPGALHPPKHSITVNAVCPVAHRTLRDRSCWNPNDTQIPSDVVVPDYHRAAGQKVFPVSQAALLGMIHAAESVLPDDGDPLNNLTRLVRDVSHQVDCTAVPAPYRLTRNLLVAILAAIPFRELHKDPDLDPDYDNNWSTPPESAEPNTLMELSRYDHLYTRRDRSNRALYSFNDETTYSRAFGHPGVGLWQLDDINGFVNLYNHAQRAHAPTAATIAAKMFLANYCRKDLGDGLIDKYAEVDPNTYKNTADPVQKMYLRIKASLRINAWLTSCYRDGVHGCFDDFLTIVEGEPFPSIPNIDNLESDRLYDGRLNLRVHTDLDDLYGGVEPLECEWKRNGARVGDVFDCYKYDIDNAEGYVFKHLRVDPERDGNLRIRSGVTNDERVSPLAFPFLSFTDIRSGTRYLVFKSDAAGKTGYSSDIIAAVPSKRDARRNTQLDPWPESQPNGWWHKNDVNGVTVEIVNG